MVVARVEGSRNEELFHRNRIPVLQDGKSSGGEWW